MTRKKQKAPSNFDKLAQDLGIAPVALYELIHNILESRGVLDANMVFLWEDIPPEYESLISDFRKYTHIPFWWAKYNELKAQKDCSDASNNANSTASLRAEIQQEQLAQIAEDLDTALQALKWSKSIAEMTKLNETHSAFYTALCDAFNNTQQAIAHIKDAPDA